jgi:hypothetical protein
MVEIGGIAVLVLGRWNPPRFTGQSRKVSVDLVIRVVGMANCRSDGSQAP